MEKIDELRKSTSIFDQQKKLMQENSKDSVTGLYKMIQPYSSVTINQLS
jgi:hypothetical protein